MKAIWNNTILAESSQTIVIERNHYFPPETMKLEYLRKSGNQYHCTWKGVADYYDIVIGDQVLPDGAWMYPEPTPPAAKIKGHFAFWKGTKVIE